MKRAIIFGLLLSALCAGGKVTPAKILQDGMVVEWTKPLTLWGTASPGEKFDVKVNNVKKKTVIASPEGKWEVKLSSLKPGGPYKIQMGDAVISDVLSGDVVLCSGQSNVELFVYRVEDMYGDLINSYANDNVRQFIAPKVVEFDSPAEDLTGGKWEKTSPSRSRNFSALGYFIGRALNEKTGRPVGIVNCSWGGTPIESWMSEKSLTGYQRQLARLAIDRDKDYRERVSATEHEMHNRWEGALWAGDPGRKEHWETRTHDVSNWEDVDPIKDRNWVSDGLNPIGGSHWFVKKVNIPADLADVPATLRVGVLVDSDSTYVNGEFVGSISYCYPPRKYRLRDGLLKAGENTISVRLVSNGGEPEFIPDKPYKLVFDNGREISLEGPWKYHAGMRMPKAPGSTFWSYSPTVLYNSMIAPTSKFPIGSVVWYQGESSVSNRNEYGDLLERLITLWRSDRNDCSLPFYIVELANYLPESNESGRRAWAEMRQVQRATCNRISNCEIIENYDLGEWNDIHPLDKKTLAERIVDKYKVGKKTKK